MGFCFHKSKILLAAFLLLNFNFYSIMTKEYNLYAIYVLEILFNTVLKYSTDQFL